MNSRERRRTGAPVPIPTAAIVAHAPDAGEGLYLASASSHDGRRRHLRLVVGTTPPRPASRAEQIAALSWAWRAAIREGRRDVARGLFFAYVDLTREAP